MIRDLGPKLEEMGVRDAQVEGVPTTLFQGRSTLLYVYLYDSI